jgi:hypothetical protein
MKFHPVGVKLYHVDRQTDISKLVVAFCNSVNMPKNQQLFPVPFRGQIHVNVEGHRNIGLVYGKAVPILQNHHAHKAYGRAQVLLHAFLILSEEGAE